MSVFIRYIGESARHETSQSFNITSQIVQFVLYKMPWFD